MKKFLAAVMTTMLVLSLAGCGSHNHSNEPEIEMADMWGASCLTESMRKYMADSVENVTNYVFGTSELSKPAAYHFTWTVQNTNEEKINDYTFVLSSDQVQSEVLFTATVTENNIDINNLLLQQNYFWSVTANLENGEKIYSEVKDFVTCGDAPRVISVDGVTNCRDLGGWKISGNQYVKQGMIYRTGRMNDNYKEKVTIKDAGIVVLRDELGVKTEIDLRQDEVRTESALGSSVKYVNIPMSGNDVYKNPTNLEKEICSVFSVLADESNYPVQIHCSVGTDRTGYICFLINGLLGVSEEDLYRDYLFSNFGKVDGMRQLTDIADTYVVMLKQQEGDTISEKIYNYLIKIGVTKTEIDSIKAILIEER